MSKGRYEVRKHGLNVGRKTHVTYRVMFVSDDEEESVAWFFVCNRQPDDIAYERACKLMNKLNKELP